MRIHYVLAATLALTALAAPMRAQEKKPGGLNKVAHDISKTTKKAGQDTKAEVRRDAGKAHGVLTKAGNDTKAELKRTTGVTSKSPSAEHKPGGVNKMARDVSHTSKELGAKAKHGVKKIGSEAHGELTKAGKDTKEAVKKP
jgi:ribosomal protein S30